MEALLVGAACAAFLLVGIGGQWRRRRRRRAQRDRLRAQLRRALRLQERRPGILAGVCDGVEFELRLEQRGRRAPRLEVWCSAPRAASLCVRTHSGDDAGAAPPSGAPVDLGDGAFAARFDVHGELDEALLTLTREVRGELLGALARHPGGGGWEALEVRQQLLRGRARLDAEGALEGALELVRKLVGLSRALGDQRIRDRFTRLASEAAKPQAPGFRRRCLEALARGGSTRLRSLRAHPDPGLRFICFEAHPEAFAHPRRRRELLEEVALNHEDPSLRARAMGHLRGVLSSEVMLDEQRPLELRLRALERALEPGPPGALGAAEGQRMLGVVIRWLEGAQPRERQAVLQVLARASWPWLGHVLEHMARWPLSSVDVEALEGVLSEALPAPRARALLTSIVEAAGPAPGRARAAEALVECGGAQALAALRRARHGARTSAHLRWRLERAIAALEARLAQEAQEAHSSTLNE